MKKTSKEPVHTVEMLKKIFPEDVVIALIVALTVAAAYFAGSFERLEVHLIDKHFRDRGQIDVPPEIVIVGITDGCLDKLGKWPWQRQIHATLISLLTRAGAAAIGFDVIIEEPNLENPLGDEALISSVKSSGQVVLPSIFSVQKRFFEGHIVSEREISEPMKRLAEVARSLGYINMDYEDLNVDGILRAMPVYEEFKGKRYPSFSLALAEVYLSKKGKISEGSLLISKAMNEPRKYINYYGPSHTFEIVPYSNIVSGKIDTRVFKDKLVIIGPMAMALQDLHHTPFGTMNGTELQANVTANIIGDDFLRRTGPIATCALLLILAMLLGHLSFRLSSRPVFLADTLAVLVIWQISYLSFSKYGLIVDTVPLLVLVPAVWIAESFYKIYLRLYFTNLRLRRKVMELGALYEVSKTVSDMMNLRTVIEKVLNQAVSVLDAERGSLMLFDPEKEKLVVEYAVGAGAGYMSGERAGMVGEAGSSDEIFTPDDAGGSNTDEKTSVIQANRIELSIGEGVAGEVFRTVRPAIVNEGSKDPRFKDFQFEKYNVFSLICVPLKVGERATGVINITNKRGREKFTVEDLKLLETIAQHAATVIENARLYKLATVDGLTGLYVHRYFQVRFIEEFKRALRYNSKISLIMTDIDHFKKFNDTYGHQFGDIVLAGVAAILRDTVRDIDFPARYGGEEFIVICPETDSEGALKLAERLRKNVEAQVFNGPKGPVKVTISLGVATYPDCLANSAEEFISFADAALYKSKATGRNRTSVYSFLSKLGQS